MRASTPAARMLGGVLAGKTAADVAVVGLVVEAGEGVAIYTAVDADSRDAAAAWVRGLLRRRDGRQRRRRR